MLRFTLHIILFNLPLTLFQICTPLISDQLKMMKWTNSYNYSTQIMMMIFGVLTSICFSLDYWLILTQKNLQYLL